MKKKILTSLLFLFLVAFSINAQQDSTNILGTWKLSSYMKGDKKIVPDDSIQRIKLITKSYFTWVQYTSKTRVIRNSAGGTYTYDGRNYTEKIDYVGLRILDSLDIINIFKVTISGDEMHLLGVLSDNTIVDEIWTKIDKK